MLDIKDIRAQITDALKGHGADYVEIRLEQSYVSRIVYRGHRVEEIGKTSSIGGNVRALVKGGWGFVSFNDFDDLKAKVALAVRQALGSVFQNIYAEGYPPTRATWSPSAMFANRESRSSMWA